MSWLIALGTGLATAVPGAIAAGILADRWTVWFRVSNFEGAAGYYVLFHILAGGVIGGGIGIVCSRQQCLRPLLLRIGTIWVTAGAGRPRWRAVDLDG